MGVTKFTDLTQPALVELIRRRKRQGVKSTVILRELAQYGVVGFDRKFHFCEAFNLEYSEIGIIGGWFHQGIDSLSDERVDNDLEPLIASTFSHWRHWIDGLSSDLSYQIFGEPWQQIVSVTSALVAGKQPSTLSLEPSSIEDATRSYGPNGISVHLFIQSLRDTPLPAVHGRSELLVSQVGNGAYTYTGVQTNSKTRSVSFLRAIERAFLPARELPFLSRVLLDARDAGAKFGLGTLDACGVIGWAACELAQMPDTEHHFFLRLMPLVRQGYFPIDWDEVEGKPLF